MKLKGTGTFQLYPLPKMPTNEPSITFNTTLDCTQQQVVQDIATIVLSAMGYVVPEGAIDPLHTSTNPRIRQAVAAAEEIFEIFWGDSPDYSDSN
jgi:hypothetical protein